ncbi:MAG: NUDIX domain-containing protein [Sandaracinaceae bacterium]|nr:NUDIX domain-containing protein [Sandaracinaceae bacterium]
MSGFVVAVACVIVRGDRALALRRGAHRDAGAGIWEVVSGRMDRAEQPLEAIAREVREECGLEVAIDPRPIDAYTMMRGEAPMVLVVYRARWLSGEVARSEEHDAHDWLTAEEAGARGMPARLLSAFSLALSPARGA